MIEKLKEAEKRYEWVSERLYDPEVSGNQNEFRELMREHKRLTPIIEKFRAYTKALDSYEEAKMLMSEADSEMRELCEEEMKSAKAESETGEAEASEAPDIMELVKKKTVRRKKTEVTETATDSEDES